MKILSNILFQFYYSCIFMFRSLIHLEITFLLGVRLGSDFFFSQVATQLIQYIY